MTDTVLVRFSVDLLRELLTRDQDGNALHLDLGDPVDSVYVPTVTVDHKDNPVRELIAALETAVDLADDAYAGITIRGYKSSMAPVRKTLNLARARLCEVKES